MRWSLGPCSSGNHDEKYTKAGTYIERCCLKSGMHILSCLTTDGSLGWKNVQIRVNEHIYCDDFISIKAMRKVLIHGMYPFKYQIIIMFNNHDNLTVDAIIYVYILHILLAQSLAPVEPSDAKVLKTIGAIKGKQRFIF